MADIWRMKRDSASCQWTKKILERSAERIENFNPMASKKSSFEIFAKYLERNPEVKTFHPRFMGLARSESLWHIYNNQTSLSNTRLEYSAPKNSSSCWPSLDNQTTTTEPNPTKPFRLHDEKDFWGYSLPTSLSKPERNISWGLSVPTEWECPVQFSFPFSVSENEGSDCESSGSFVDLPLPRKSDSVSLQVFENQLPAAAEEDPKELLVDDNQSGSITPETVSDSSTEESESESVPSDVEPYLYQTDKPSSVSKNFSSCSMRVLLLETPGQPADAHKERPLFSNRIVEEGSRFSTRSNQPTALSVL